ncbi:hypothetical protein VTO42DRAFT_3642 [Malbranchea cinnamomea]
MGSRRGSLELHLEEGLVGIAGRATREFFCDMQQIRSILLRLCITYVKTSLNSTSPSTLPTLTPKPRANTINSSVLFSVFHKLSSRLQWKRYPRTSSSHAYGAGPLD